MHSGKLAANPLRGLGVGDLLHVFGQFHHLLGDGSRAENLCHAPVGHDARADVHGDSRQQRGGNGQRRSPQPGRRGLLDQSPLDGRQHTGPQLGADAARL